MTRIRTHNRRSKRIGYVVFARKRHHARKLIRFATFYGMGQQKLKDIYGTATGRMVVYGPGPMHSLPKLALGRHLTVPLIAVNFAEQEARALEWHHQSLEQARKDGHTVIEHTYADATIFAGKES